jgi:hypothetical protein
LVISEVSPAAAIEATEMLISVNTRRPTAVTLKIRVIG